MDDADRKTAAAILELLIRTEDPGLHGDEIVEIMKTLRGVTKEHTEKLIEELLDMNMAYYSVSTDAYTAVRPEDYGMDSDASLNAIQYSEHPEYWFFQHLAPSDDSDLDFQGEFTLDTDEVFEHYKGGIKNGRYHGFGAFESSYIQYCGMYKEGIFHGHGAYTDIYGCTIEGEWVEGELHGHATAVLNNGIRIETDDMHHQESVSFGKSGGTITLPNGDTYRSDDFGLPLEPAMVLVDTGQDMACTCPELWFRNRYDLKSCHSDPKMETELAYCVATFSEDFKIRRRPITEKDPSYAASRDCPKLSFGGNSNIIIALKKAVGYLNKFSVKMTKQGRIVLKPTIYVITNGLFADKPHKISWEYEGVCIVGIPVMSGYKENVCDIFGHTIDYYSKGCVRDRKHDIKDLYRMIEQHPEGISMEDVQSKAYWVRKPDISRYLGILEGSMKVKMVGERIKARTYRQSKLDVFGIRI